MSIDLGDLFKELVWDNLVDYFIKNVLFKLPRFGPILAWGPLGWLVTEIVTRLLGRFYDALHEFLDLKEIGFRREGLREEFDRASVELKIIAINRGKDSSEFKAARRKHRDSLKDFIDLSGVNSLA